MLPAHKNSKPRTVPARMSAKRRAQFEAEGRIPFSTIQRKEKSWNTNAQHARSSGCAEYTNAPRQKSGNVRIAAVCEPHIKGRTKRPIPPRKKRTRPISETQRLRLKALKLIRDRWWAEGKRTCGICGKEILERDEYTLDHIEPGSAKSDAEDNLQPAHGLCNLRKGSRRNFTLKGKRP